MTRQLTHAEKVMLEVSEASHLRIVEVLVRAHRARVDIGDLLAAACRDAAVVVQDDLTEHRRGSWEAEHVRALSFGWDWEDV